MDVEYGQTPAAAIHRTPSFNGHVTDPNDLQRHLAWRIRRTFCYPLVDVVYFPADADVVATRQFYSGDAHYTPTIFAIRAIMREVAIQPRTDIVDGWVRLLHAEKSERRIPFQKKFFPPPPLRGPESRIPLDLLTPASEPSSACIRTCRTGVHRSIQRKC